MYRYTYFLDKSTDLFYLKLNWLTSKRSGPSASWANKAGLDDETSDCWIRDVESVFNEMPVKGEQTGFKIDDDGDDDADIKRISSINNKYYSIA